MRPLIILLILNLSSARQCPSLRLVPLLCRWPHWVFFTCPRTIAAAFGALICVVLLILCRATARVVTAFSPRCFFFSFRCLASPSLALVEMVSLPWRLARSVLHWPASDFLWLRLLAAPLGLTASQLPWRLARPLGLSLFLRTLGLSSFSLLNSALVRKDSHALLAIAIEKK